MNKSISIYVYIYIYIYIYGVPKLSPEPNKKTPVLQRETMRDQVSGDFPETR